MKVAILTIHHVPNFGAILQAYAIARVAEELGHEVTMLDYRPSVATQHYYGMTYSGWRPRIAPFIGARIRMHQALRFARQKLPLSARIYTSGTELAEAVSSYDSILVGSDQIWCTNEGTFRGYDPTFFLDFVNGTDTRKISYAASTGESPTFAEHTDEVASLLNDFYAVSVRESHSCEMIANISRHQPEHVVDPTLLHDFSHLEARRKLPVKPYIVVYGSAPREEEWKCIERIAKSLSAEIVAASPMRDRRFDHSYGYTDPATWLQLLKNSSAVITSYYHGVVLSTKFKVPFLVLPMKGKGRKINDFLDRFDLRHRVLSTPSRFDESTLSSDDIKARDEQINAACERSRDFLRVSLD